MTQPDMLEAGAEKAADASISVDAEVAAFWMPVVTRTNGPTTVGTLFPATYDRARGPCV
jgi:hypothetical protein